VEMKKKKGKRKKNREERKGAWDRRVVGKCGEIKKKIKEEREEQLGKGKK